MKKEVRGHCDPYLALLDYRNTHAEVGSSPAQRLSAGGDAICYLCQLNN